MKEGSNVPADLLLLVRWVTDPRLCDFSFAAWFWFMRLRWISFHAWPVRDFIFLPLVGSWILHRFLIQTPFLLWIFVFVRPLRFTMV
jgi:hypothetical protein